jgi:hypothetical protein
MLMPSCCLALTETTTNEAREASKSDVDWERGLMAERERCELNNTSRWLGRGGLEQ